jgi:hypothetical protein
MKPMAPIPVVDPVRYDQLKQDINSAVQESSLPQWARDLFYEAYTALDVMGTKRWEIKG